MDGYVPKPVQAQQLFEALERLTPAAEDSAPPQTPPKSETGDIDWTMALEQLDGDRELLQELIGVFQQEWPGWRRELGQAVACGDSKGVKRLAHTIKGAVAQFVTGAALTAAEQLEKIGQEGNLQHAATVCATLEQEIERLLPALAGFSNGPS
jgi:HPt (histidine-containing phosphotransfer) domain-containing protein